MERKAEAEKKTRGICLAAFSD